jgi:hypothetical protein
MAVRCATVRRNGRRSLVKKIRCTSRFESDWGMLECQHTRTPLSIATPAG